MTDLSRIKHKLSLHKAECANRFRVKNLAVFGSYARDEQREDSDIDILVEFETPVGIEFIDLGNYLERLLNVRVDLIRFWSRTFLNLLKRSGIVHDDFGTDYSMVRELFA